MEETKHINILKPLWARRENGRWGIHDLKSLTLFPKAGHQPDFFTFDSRLELLTQTPPRNLASLFQSFGPTDFLMKQSIVPVISWKNGAQVIRCIGTAFIVSCTGYAITAAHVVLDPQDSGDAKQHTREGNIDIIRDVMLGVLMPINPASGINGFRVIPFERVWYWGDWIESPLFHEPPKHQSLTDIAICKLPLYEEGAGYQPLTMSLNPFVPGEEAYAIGYAGMQNITMQSTDGKKQISEFQSEMYVATGKIQTVFPTNHIHKEVPTPGPAFDFTARIPGKMSGAPIFGAKGAVIRGVVSRSFSEERHAFGCMLGPVMNLPLNDGNSLKRLMDNGQDGIAVLHGHGL